MVLRWPLEGHFELFWALVAKWLSDGPWRLSLSCCDSRGAESIVKYMVRYSRGAESILKYGVRYSKGAESIVNFRVRYSRGAASIGPLEGRFELFWPVVTKWLSDDLWRVILSSSELWWPNGSQMASGG